MVTHARPLNPPGHGAGFRVAGVDKSFGDQAVLRGIDLTVPAGQFVAVIGRSGCGKSTLLRLLAGLEQPTAGQISFGAQGEAVNTRLMFQEPRLLPWERVLDNVVVGVAESETDGVRRERAARRLQEVGLADRAGEWPAVLSCGQRQRVALARALASSPTLLLLDEPLGALDALTRIEMHRLLEDLWQAGRFTAVLVTHDVSEALALADRVVLSDAGRLTLERAVTLPRPRRRGHPELGRLEERILDELFDGRDGADRGDPATRVAA